MCDKIILHFERFQKAESVFGKYGLVKGVNCSKKYADFCDICPRKQLSFTPGGAGFGSEVEFVSQLRFVQHSTSLLYNPAARQTK